MYKRLKLMFYNSYHLFLRTFHLRKNKDLYFTAEPILKALHSIKAFIDFLIQMNAIKIIAIVYGSFDKFS